ncbi:MAG: hypothetical protein HQL88_10115 [Magnetococcales bacterium]|nr:hypothetical protein [Magnetococcales bacterium]
MKTIPLTCVAGVGLLSVLWVVPMDRLAVVLFVAIVTIAHTMAVLLWVSLMALAGWLVWFFCKHGNCAGALHPADLQTTMGGGALISPNRSS